MSLFFWRKNAASRKPLADSKYANAYLFVDRLVIHSQLHTPFGLFASEPFQRLDRHAPPDEVGRCISIGLNLSRHEPDKPHGKEFAKFYLKAMGVKSNGELQRTALCVGLSQLSGNIEFRPTHNGGAVGEGKGYGPIPNLSPLTVASDAPPAEIGNTLLKAFQLCTSVDA